LCADVFDQVNIDENPAPADLRARNFPGACLLLQRYWMDVQESSGGLQIERIHDARYLRVGRNNALAIRIPMKRPCDANA
jgi:hypothetical protein